MATPVRVTMTVNGEQRTAEVEPRLLLVHYLRDHLGLQLVQRRRFNEDAENRLS